jgi:cytochrome c biogenesis protein CcmG/thiol:disulfide interchange protein DsbE
VSAGPPVGGGERSSGATPRLIAIGLPIVVVVALLGWAVVRDPDPAASGVGEPAARFALRSLDGDLVRLDDLRGRVVVLNFWASWCGPCLHEAPELEAAWRRLPRAGAQLLGIVFEDTASSARSFARSNGVSWPLLLDPGSRTAISYGVTGIPETVVIAPDGTVVRHHIGEVRASQVQTWVDLASSGRHRG